MIKEAFITGFIKKALLENVNWGAGGKWSPLNWTVRDIMPASLYDSVLSYPGRSALAGMAAGGLLGHLVKGGNPWTIGLGSLLGGLGGYAGSNVLDTAIQEGAAKRTLGEITELPYLFGGGEATQPAPTYVQGNELYFR